MNTTKFYFVIAILVVANTVLGQSYNYTPALQSWNPCTTTTLTERVFNSKGNLVGSSTTYKAGNVTSRIYAHDEKSGAIIFGVKKCSGNFNNAGAMIVIDGSTGDYWTATYKANASTAAVGFTNFSLKNGTNNFYVLITGSTANNIDEYFFAGKVTIFKTAPSLSISSSSNSVSAESGTGVISVNGSGNVNWTASSNASWLRLNNTFSGSNSGNVDYEFDANLTTSSRTAKITVSGSGITKTFTLTQKGKVENLLMDPTGVLNVLSTSGSGDVCVKSNVNFTVCSDVDWLSLNTVAASNNEKISYFYRTNTTSNNRTGIITVSSESGIIRKLSIVQEGVVDSLENTAMIENKIYLIKIHPNPCAGGIVTISTDLISSNLQVIDITGKKLYEDNFYSNIKLYDFGSILQKGVYLIKINRVTNKLIIN